MIESKQTTPEMIHKSAAIKKRRADGVRKSRAYWRRQRV